MKIEYTCDDGSTTTARTASLAMMYWYARVTDQKRILPSPYGKNFLALVVSKVESKHGELPSYLKSWPSTPANDFEGDCWDFEDVESLYNGGDVAVVNYETYCLEMLKWLVDHGDVVELQLDGKLLRNPKQKYRSIDDTWELS